MRWQMQTLAGGPSVPPEERGDCFRACVASILNVPLKSLPNPHDNWDQGWAEALAEHGLELARLNIERFYPYGFWIAELPSLNLPGCLHVVVMRGGELAHDPAINKRYDDSEILWRAGRAAIVGGYQLAPLDPSIPESEAESNG